MMSASASTFSPLPRSFYQPSAKAVAPRLLGHWLVRRTATGFCGGPIVETEAYLRNDPACHAARGCTPRNRVMFGPPGYSYVYLIYGYHFCVNAVCCPEGIAEAVLIRAVEAVFEPDLMQHRRPVNRHCDLTNGPAKLCAAMDITRELNGLDLCEPASPLIIAANPAVKAFLKERGPVVTTTRIGISQAADLALRFYLDASPFVSRKAAARP